MTLNQYFKGAPLFDVEFLKNDTRQTRYYRRLIDSEMWPIELYRRQ